MSSDSTVEELVIFAGASVIPASLNVNWALYSDGGTVPGTLLYSGTDAAAFTDTGANFGCCNTLNIFSILIDIPDVALLAGDYWVAFLISSSTTPIYWADTTDGDSKVASGSSLTSYVAGYPPPPGTSHARGFQVLGSAAAVPLPAALPLFATGLGALGLLGWRRKRKHAALAA